MTGRRRRRGHHTDHTRPQRRQYGPRVPQQRDPNTEAEQTAMNQALEAMFGQGNGPRLDPDGIRGSSTDGVEAMLRARAANIPGITPQTPIAEVAARLAEAANTQVPPNGQPWRETPEGQQNINGLRGEMGALARNRRGVGFMPGWQGQQPAPQAGVPDPAAPQAQPRDPKAAGVLQPPAAEQPPSYESIEGAPVTPQGGNVVPERASPVPQWERPMLPDPAVRTQSGVPQWERQLTQGQPQPRASAVPQWERPMAPVR